MWREGLGTWDTARPGREDRAEWLLTRVAKL